MFKKISDNRKRAITDSLVTFIAEDMRPINIVEGSGFKRLIKTLEPGYTLPKQEIISHALKEKHKCIRNKVLSDIEKCSAISFTTDIWTSQQMEAYMTVTAHLINSDWELENYVLETKSMEESQTASNIAERLGEVADAYAVSAEKRVAVVHDNAANMILCTDMLKQEEAWGDVKGVRCAGHTLQLCVNAALKHDPVLRTVAAGRRLVGQFKKSAKASAALKEKQQAQQVPAHKLIQDVATRWNSTCFMLERLCEQRWPISAVLSDPIVTKKMTEILT